jgi:tetratricopeptide (TPR) repeat protein
MKRSNPKRGNRRRRILAAAVTVLGFAIIFYVQHRVSEETSEPIRSSTPSVVEEREAVKELQQAGHPEEALSRADRALERHPSDWRLLETKGDILLSLGRVREAVRSYEACVQVQPLGYWTPWMKLAAAQEEIGAFADAEATYRNLLSHNPGHAAAHTRLSRLLSRTSEPS